MTLNFKDSVSTSINVLLRKRMKRKGHLIFGFVNLVRIQIEDMEYK
jgi:hypothetical protein